MKKKMFTLWMTGLFLLLTTLGAAAQNSGTTGPLNWNYDAGTKTLTITGTGAMPDFANADAQPWKDVRNEIEKVKIEAGVKSVGAYAFRNSAVLTSVTLPAGVQTIGEAAFNDCAALTSVTLPEGLTTIGKYAFSGCSALTSITLPGSVTAIGEQVFGNCTALTDVTVGWAAPLGIQANVFHPSVTLQNIKLHVPAGRTKAYRGKDVWKKFKQITDGTITNSPLDATQTWWEYDDATRTLTVGGTGAMPEFADWDDQPWKDLREKKIKTVVIETGVTGIGKQAFWGFDVMTSVTLPEGVETIGEHAFRNCNRLPNITLPKSVTTIGEWAFADSPFLGEVTVGWTEAGSIPNLPASAFSYPNTKVLHVPAGTAEMYRAKDEWKKLFIMDGKTAGGNFSTGLHWAYNDETKELTVTGAGEIPDYNYPNEQPWCAFGGKAQTLTLGEGVTKIGKNAFASFHVLLSVTLPKSVATIGESAFVNCYKLADVTVAWTDNNIPIPHGGAFSSSRPVLHVPAGTVETYKTKDVWKEFLIMDGKTAGGDLSTGLHWEYNDETKALSITGAGEIPGYNSFKDRPWDALKMKAQTVTLGEGITKIGEVAFYHFKVLPSITIPKSVTEIREDAFEACIALTDVTVAWKDAGSIPDIQANVFKHVTLRYVKLYVPEGMVDIYKAKNVWKDFDIQETPPTLSAALTDAAPMASAAGSTKQIKVQGNKKWKATIPAAAQTWLEFAGGDGITIVSESPDTTLTVKAKNANGITAARTATLDFVFEDGSGPATPVTVAVTQIATPAPTPTPTPTPKPTPTPTPKPLPEKKISSITLNSSSRVINGEASFRITATINPGDATEKFLSWRSSDEKVATVKVIPTAEKRSGSALRAYAHPTVETAEVTIVGKGQAEIIVKALDGSGVQAVCSVDVRSTVGNALLPAARIYAAGGRVYLTLPQATSVRIYTASGTLQRTMHAPAGTSSVALPEGVYVVKAGARTEKVFVN